MFNSTDRNTELAVLEVVRERFPDHLVLGEEGGVIGDSTSEYLWCIDPVGMSFSATHLFHQNTIRVSQSLSSE